MLESRDVSAQTPLPYLKQPSQTQTVITNWTNFKKKTIRTVFKGKLKYG
jgi:hypothetical protein